MELFNLGIKMEQPASKAPEGLGKDKVVELIAAEERRVQLEEKTPPWRLAGPEGQSAAKRPRESP